jgi:tetratricopeptide (TPR) repeat protein
MNNLAGCYSNLGRHADALELGQKTVALAKETLGPDHPYTLRFLDTLARIYRNLDRHGEALKLYEEVLALMKIKFGPGHSDTLGSMNSLAELLATCPDARLRDPKRAVELAKDAVELAPRSSWAWQVLGWARYRTGAWKDSIAALEKSIELREDGGGSFQWFFLAMAHWQVGNKEQARKWYGRAVEWADRIQPADAQLRRFRAEAAELLGLNERK